MRKGTDSNIPAIVRIQVWAGRRLFVVLGVMALALLIAVIGFFSATKRAAKERQELLKTVEYLSHYALVMTPDGWGGFVKKQGVSSAMLSRYVLRSVENYFILDRNAFKRNGVLIPADPRDEENFVKTLLELPRIKPLSSFFKGEEAGSYFYGYLSYLYGLAKASRLPDTIAVDGGRDPQVEFKGKGADFDAKLVIPVSYSYVGFDGKVHAGKGEITFIIGGTFDPANADDVNPYGMTVKSLKIQYIEL